MRIPKIKNYLKDHYNGKNMQTATMLLGDPGIGKSVAGKEASQDLAEQMGLPFVDYTDQRGMELLESGEDAFIFNNLPLVECEPSDLVGIPRDAKNGDEHVRFKPLLWAKLMSENPGMLMLDDFLDVQRPDLFSAAYKITLERRAGYIQLHDNVMILGASNTPEQSSLSQMIPAPLANRMVILEANRPTLKEWGQWMNKSYGDDWNKKVLGFLQKFKNDGYLLKRPSETEVLHNFPTPRTWTKTCLELESNTNREAIEGLLGPEVAQKLQSFLMVDVDIDNLIKNPSKWKKQELDAKYMLCIELSNWLSEAKNPENAFNLLDEMLEDSRQYPVLTFLAINTRKLTNLFKDLFSHEEKYSEIVSQVVRDKSAIGL